MIRYLFLIPRYLKRVFFTFWNRAKLWANDVQYGRNVRVYNKTAILIHKGGKVQIGDNFHFASIATFNPLVRNVGGGNLLWLER